MEVEQISDRITVSRQDGEVIITRRWFERVLAYVLSFMVVLCIYMLLKSAYSRFVSHEGLPLTFPLLMVLLLLFGLTLYIALSLYLNATIIRVTDKLVEVTQGPVPFMPSFSLERAQIATVTRPLMSRSVRITLKDESIAGIFLGGLNDAAEAERIKDILCEVLGLSEIQE